VKRSDRDESIQVVIHLCMEAMLGIPLYSYPYVKVAKNAMSFLLLLMSSLQQNVRRGQNRFCLEARGVAGKGRGGGQRGETAQTMYAHMNKKKCVCTMHFHLRFTYSI
jgi:hypothetical protein